MGIVVNLHSDTLFKEERINDVCITMKEGLSGKSYFLMICTLTSNTKENGLTKPGY